MDTVQDADVTVQLLEDFTVELRGWFKWLYLHIMLFKQLIQTK